MVDVLDRYARENGYVAILDTPRRTRRFFFASTNIDVTQDIVKLYDQAIQRRLAHLPARLPCETSTEVDHAACREPPQRNAAVIRSFIFPAPRSRTPGVFFWLGTPWYR